MTSGVLDEVLTRLHSRGPEMDGWLSNHGPMAAEALVRLGRQESAHAWVTGYSRRLEERPRGISCITAEEWRDPLGDATRTGDWLDFFAAEVRTRPWTQTLALWWPRLLPGIAAGATHGVIRTGHAVRALREQQTEPRLDELSQALAYWAARWQPVPGPPPAGRRSPGQALAHVPAVPHQQHGIRNRLAQLSDTGGWQEATAALQAPEDAPGAERALIALTDAAVADYASHGHAAALMLVHAATAPNAVLMALSSLPPVLWIPSHRAAWLASAAVTAAYRPAARDGGPAHPRTPPDLDSAVDAAVATADEHAIKLADTAASAHGRGLGPVALQAIARGTQLIPLD